MNNNEIILKTGREEYRKIRLSDIKIIEIEGNYTHFKFLNEKDNITLCKSYSKINETYKLENFIRIRKNVIINKDKITFFKAGKEPIIKINTGEKFKPSRRYLKDIKDNLPLIK